MPSTTVRHRYSRAARPVRLRAWLLAATSLLLPPLATGEAFLVIDGHQCLDALRSSNGSVVACDPVDAYAEAVVAALFEAGHIAVDARVELELPSARGAEGLLRTGDVTAPLGDGYAAALRLASDAGADVLVLLLGDTTRRVSDGGGIDAVAYTAHVVALVIDTHTAHHLGGDVRTDRFTGADSPVMRRDLARRTSAAVAQVVLDTWRQASAHRQQEIT